MLILKQKNYLGNAAQNKVLPVFSDSRNIKNSLDELDVEDKNATHKNELCFM
jgi:hypothetical protein